LGILVTDRENNVVGCILVRDPIFRAMRLSNVFAIGIPGEIRNGVFETKS
jgi:hypothetical protein